MAWADDIVVTLDNIGAKIGSTANTEVATTDITATGTTDAYTLNYFQCKKQGDAMLMTKSVSPYISNKTAMPGNIKSVEVFINSGASGKATYDCAFSTTECMSATSGIGAVNITGGSSHVFSNSNVEGKYFCITLGNANNGQVLKLVITCEAGGDTPVDQSVATTTTIDASGITNTDVYTNTAAGKLTATVTADGNTIEGATVTWSSSKENVATIAADGTVTLVAAGTTTITASYAGVENEYKASDATYELTVTSSAPDTQKTEIEAVLNDAFFGTNYGGTASGITDSTPETGTIDNVTITYAGSGNHYINNSQIRFYPNNKLTFAAPEGYNISSIVFTSAGTWTATISANTGTYNSNDKQWTGTASTVVFTGSGSGRCDMSKATITLTKAGLPIPELSFSSTTAEATIGEAFTAPTLSNESEVAVTYSSSDETVATVDASNGTVTLVAAGTTIITAEFAGNETYAPNSASYTLTVNKAAEVEDGFFNFADKRLDYGSGVTTTDNGNIYITEDKTWVAGNVTLVTSGKYRWWDADGTLRFYSNDPASTMTFSVPEGYVITNIEITGGLQWAANLGTYTANNGNWEGKSQEVVFTYNSSSSINVKTVRVTYEEGAAMKNPELAFSATEVTANLGEAFSAPTLTFAEGFNGTITYSSTKTDVATVNETTGEVSIAAAGITTIKAEFAGDNDWNASSASYTLTVVDPNAPGSENYPYTVADALEADPADNDVYVTGIISHIDEVSTKYGNATYYISDDGKTTSQMKVYRGKYLANAAFTKEGQIEVGNIVVVKGKISVYQNVNQLAQGNYITSQAIPVTISANAKGKNYANADRYFATLYYSDKNLKMTGANLNAHPVKVKDGKISNIVTYSSNNGNVIPAGMAVMLEAVNPGTYTFEVVDEYTDPEYNYILSQNMLHGTDEVALTTAPGDGYKFYALSLNKSNTPGTAGFYFRNGCPNGQAFENGAHKAYLAVPADVAGDAKYFVFGEETDGIRQIENGELTIENAEIYNLSGQRVNKAQKGVYIVNGKKVVIR